MIDVWSIYQSDLGLTYPLLAVNIRNNAEIVTDIDLFSLLPENVENSIIKVKSGCSVPGLIPRKIKLYLSDDSQYELNYPMPFNQELYDDLAASISVRAFEFVGERINQSRLRRMLNRGS